ncbi:hypothetical protein [uncultured Nocardioides sp.]|uniref:hypothetical protein n=1 Tax=uncultured Nocardioides sp. TaxID=198441 RepID=UPI002632C9E4|nr:hypothetical protein [uncultured Nocardioides sp.]
MTMAATVDVSDSLDEARTRLIKTARALNGAWAASLCSMLGLVVASLALLLVAVTVRPVYVVIWSVLLAAAGYNATRFWPRRTPRSGRYLSKAERAALRGVLDPDGRMAWPDVVRLVPRPELELGEGELVLGMPLLACLDAHELRELLTVAAVQASVEDEREVRWALRVAHGDVGRQLVGRRPRLSWATLRITETLRSRAAALEADLGNWAGACERAAVAALRSSSRSGAAAQEARDQVADAWQLLQQEWLAPAFARGRREVAPFTGLRRFVEGADAAGWLGSPRPGGPTCDVLADLVARHEDTVARDLGPRHARLQAITWEEYPVEVELPRWRALVTEVLDAARRTTGDPAVTLDTVLVLLESGRSHELAEATAVERGLTPAHTTAYVEWHENFTSRLLTAAVAVAAVDSLHFKPEWSWPEGTRLVAEDGWELPLESVVAEVLGLVREGAGPAKAYGELREALVRLDIDVHEPLWLDHDLVERPERPIGSFAARQGLAPRMAIVTDRSLHVFQDTQGARLNRILGPVTQRDASFELRKRMLKVWQGDTGDQVLTVAAEDVRRARIGPATGGLWWRLTLSCADGTVVLRGRGDGLEEEAEVREWLGDRVERPWLAAAPAVRSVRNIVGLVGVTLGTLALLWGVLLTALSPSGMPDPLPAVLAIGGFVALLLAVLPDAVVDLVQRLRRARVSSVA